MPTLQQQRRSIADAMSASRAATGQASRQETGRSVAEHRTGRAVVDDINRLTNTQAPRKTLRPVVPLGSLPASRGRGQYKPPAASSGGIASPLVENTVLVNGVSVADRTYWASGLVSSDGLFVLPAIKTLNLTDANGAAVQVQLAAPGGGQ